MAGSKETTEAVPEAVAEARASEEAEAATGTGTADASASTAADATKSTAAAADATASAAAVADAKEAEAGTETELLVQAAADLVLAQAEAEEWKGKYLRLHAEWDTYRRRTAEQRAEEKACANEKLVEHLLPMIDDFERTIDYAKKNGESGLLGGVEAVHTKLIDTLVKEGVIVLDPKGEAFDALECQAISTIEDKTVCDETVADVLQKGYKMGKKVLRPAMVIVATGGTKREPAPKD
ncbi:MAG: nucleotide exchange factor GrpE [Coriobacteriaceae bacterium]|nr:nucleotide exchange factor GrpE [Coriobacteriaceae bacterium]